jgi:transposase
MEFPLTNSKIWLLKEPIDFRSGLYRLCDLVVTQLKQPIKEGFFIFHNRRGDSVKCLCWHKNGFVMLYKKIEKGRFSFMKNKQVGTMLLEKVELEWLLAGLPWHEMRHWQELDYDKFS